MFGLLSSGTHDHSVSKFPKHSPNVIWTSTYVRSRRADVDKELVASLRSDNQQNYETRPAARLFLERSLLH